MPKPWAPRAKTWTSAERLTAGYAVMKPLALQAIAQAERTQKPR